MTIIAIYAINRRICCTFAAERQSGAKEAGLHIRNLLQQAT